MFKISLLLLFVVFFSCSVENNEIKNRAATYNLNIREALNQKEKQLLLSNFTKKLRYIPLETSKYCLLKRVSLVYMSSRYIFLYDNKELYQFDTAGKFIRKIGSVGKGPMDHGRRLKFKVDTISSEIYIFSYQPNKMNVYDMETGAFKRNHKINFEVANFELFPKDRITLFTTEYGFKKPAAKMLNEVYLTDRSVNKIDSITNYDRLNNHNNIAGYIYSYNDGKRLCYMGNFKDTLFHLNSEFQKSPYISFKMGNKEKWEELNLVLGKPNKYSNFVTIGRMFETEEYFFFTVRVGITPSIKKNLLYNKNSNEIINTDGLTNNIDGGISFWPIYFTNQKLLTFYQAYEILEYGKTVKDTSKLSDEYLNLINNLKEDDNPVLVIME